MAADQSDLGLPVLPERERLAAEGWWRCNLCHLDYQEGDGPPHGNVCRRWECARCRARFALFPDPLSKQYGKAPLCRGCLSESLPKPDYRRALRVSVADDDEE